MPHAPRPATRGADNRIMREIIKRHQPAPHAWLRFRKARDERSTPLVIPGRAMRSIARGRGSRWKQPVRRKTWIPFPRIARCAADTRRGWQARHVRRAHSARFDGAAI